MYLYIYIHTYIQILKCKYIYTYKHAITEVTRAQWIGIGQDVFVVNVYTYVALVSKGEGQGRVNTQWLEHSFEHTPRTHCQAKKPARERACKRGSIRERVHE